MKISKTLAILYFALCALTIAKKTDVNLMSIIQEKKLAATDSGHAVNCGHVPINVTWTPKDLSPAGQVTIDVDFLLPQDFNGGLYNASIYLHGQTDPLFGYADNFDCDKVKAYIPCPIPKGFPLKASETITNLHGLAPFLGNYDIIIQVWNTKKQEMFCVNLTVNVLETNHGTQDYVQLIL